MADIVVVFIGVSVTVTYSLDDTVKVLLGVVVAEVELTVVIDSDID